MHKRVIKVFFVFFFSLSKDEEVQQNNALIIVLDNIREGEIKIKFLFTMHTSIKRKTESYFHIVQLTELTHIPANLLLLLCFILISFYQGVVNKEFCEGCLWFALCLGVLNKDTAELQYFYYLRIMHVRGFFECKFYENVGSFLWGVSIILIKSTEY